MDLKFNFDEERFQKYLDNIKGNVEMNFKEINDEYGHYTDYLKDVIDVGYLVDSGILSFSTEIFNNDGEKIEFK